MQKIHAVISVAFLITIIGVGVTLTTLEDPPIEDINDEIEIVTTDPSNTDSSFISQAMFSVSYGYTHLSVVASENYTYEIRENGTLIQEGLGVKGIKNIRAMRNIISGIMIVYTVDFIGDNKTILFTASYANPAIDDYGITHVNITKVWYEVRMDEELQSTFVANHLDYAIQNLTTFENSNDMFNVTSDLYEIWDFTTSYIIDEILSRDTASYSFVELDGAPHLNITYIETHDATFNLYIDMSNGLLSLVTAKNTFEIYDFFDIITITATSFYPV